MGNEEAVTVFEFPNPSGGEWKRAEPKEKRAPEPITVRGQELTKAEGLEVVTVRRVILKTLTLSDAQILLRNGWELVQETEL